MYGDTWQVRWKEFLSDSYVYGSKIEFNEDGSVSYKNRLMPPGTVIHTWYSMTNFQGNRIEPSLPLIDGERAYSIAVNIDYHNSESEALMLRIIFFDRYDVQAQSIIVRDKKAFFKPSIRTYSYRIAVIGIGRMNNSRSERQARGRAGRQGDPGFSQYYVSLEDDIVGAEDDDKLQRYIDGKKRIGKRKIKRIVNQCQKLSVESEEMNRKKSLQYDQVLQRQRDLIYATRKNLLDGASVEQEKIVGIAKENISDFVNHFDCIQSNKKHGRRRGRKKDSDKNTNTQQYTSMLNRYILDNISYKLDAGLSKSDMQSAATVSDYLMLRVYQGLSRQRERIGDEEAYEQFVREATLKAVDDGWVELIDYLEQLKYAVAGRASAQRNVMFEYQNEAFESFLDTEKAVKCNIIRNILLSDVKIGKDGRLQVIYP